MAPVFTSAAPCLPVRYEARQCGTGDSRVLIGVEICFRNLLPKLILGIGRNSRTYLRNVRTFLKRLAVREYEFEKIFIDLNTYKHERYVK